MMKLKDTEGKIVSVAINSNDYPVRSKSKSDIQEKVGKYLKNRFKMYTILEEWPIPGKTGMSLDFIVFPIKIAIEVQGEQHIKFVKHFHGTLDGFKKQKMRDKRKQEWCEENEIELIKVFKVEELEKLLP